MSYLPSSPDLADLPGILTKYPRRGVLLFKLLEDIRSSASPLSRELRETLIAYVSGLNRNKEDGLMLDTDDFPPQPDQKMQAVLGYVKKLTLTPGQLTEQDAQDIFNAGWDEQAFLESVCICAIVNCLNRFVTGTGIEAASLPQPRLIARRLMH